MPCSGGRDAKALSVPRPTDNRRAADEPSWGAARRTWCGRRKRGRRAQLPWDGPGQGAAPAAPKLRCGACLGGWRSRRRDGVKHVVRTRREIVRTSCFTSPIALRPSAAQRKLLRTTSRSSRAWGSTQKGCLFVGHPRRHRAAWAAPDWCRHRAGCVPASSLLFPSGLCLGGARGWPCSLLTALRTCLRRSRRGRERCPRPALSTRW